MNRPASRALAMGAAGAVGLMATALAVPAQAAEEPATTEVQILGINDFHGRILPDSFGEAAGAASLATAIADLEEDYANSVFVAAGDLIGASTFESFIAKDKPTIDALNAAGLDVSAVGNHEFDGGYDDLISRVMAPFDAETNPLGGAEWEYLGANVRLVGSGDPALPETWIQDFGDVEVGFVGVVTDETPSLVSPDGVANLTFEEEAVAANRSAADLEEAGADLIVLLVHEGAPTTAYADAVDTSNDFGAMLAELDPSIDAVVSGHTHLAYDHRVPVAEWITEGRAVTERPVVSSGQYGMNVNRLVFEVDDVTGDVVGLSTDTVDLWVGGAAVYPQDPEVAQMVADATAEADILGAEVLGELEMPLYRARTASGATGSTRGAESTLGNAIAEVQRWATAGNGAEIAFMNPGGLRGDMLGVANGTGDYPSDVTYKQAAGAQPFANTLVTMTLTGVQLAEVLEEQWQPAGSSRPFLRLGTSEGFGYTYDPTGRTISQMWIGEDFIEPTDTVTVAVNSFLAAGGDNFTTFAEGTDRADSGRIDLNAMVDYLDQNGSLGTDYAQHAIGVSGDLTPYEGGMVDIDLSSLAMTGPGDLVDSTVTVTLQGEELGTFPVDNALPTDTFDEHGKATIAFELPAGVTGEQILVVEGDTTGTIFPIVIDIVEFGDISTDPASPEYSEHAESIQWLARENISQGWTLPDGTVEFRPLALAGRDALAAFVYRLAGEPDFEAPAEPTFSDVTPESTEFYTEIEWLAAQGITTGYPDGTFRPTAKISRDAVAAFLYRLAGEPEFEAPVEPTFADVTPETSAYYTEIEWLASEGIAQGWSDGTFRATAKIKRDAVAAFLDRFAEGWIA